MKCKKNSSNIEFWFAIAIILSILFLPSSGFSEATFKIKPMFSAYARSDSNFWKAEEGEREVYTYTLQPGILVGAETAKSKVDLSYFLEAFFYEDKDTVPKGERDADDDNYLGQLGILDVLYSPVERFTLGLNDSFYLTRRPVASDRFSDSIERVEYWINRFTPKIYYEFKERFAVGLRYRRTDLDSDDDRDDFVEHRGLFDLIYNPTRTITVDLNYQRWTLDHDENLLEEAGSEYTSDQIRLDIEKRYNYFSFEGGVGYQKRDFKDSDVNDEETMVYIVTATWQNPPRAEEAERFGRDFVRAQTHIYFAYERNFNTTGYEVDTFVADRFTASIARTFLGKLRGMIRGYYQISDFNDQIGLTPSGNQENREDKTYDIEATIEYLINEKMSVSLTGGQEERDSNLAGFDYDNTYVALSFDFDYDIGARGDFSKEAAFYR